MKRILYIALILIGVNTSLDSFAQVILNGEAEIRKVKLEKVENHLKIRMDIDVSPAAIKSNREMRFTPQLRTESNTLNLPAVIVTGRKRQIYRDRNPKYFTQENNMLVVPKRKKDIQFINYDTAVEFESWMDGAELVIVEQECGCATTLLSADDHLLEKFEVPIIVRPSLAYVQPEVERKTREIEATAYLDFPVNRTDIQLNYRRNSNEIYTIRESIDKVISEKDIEISSILLTGHASPEGPYANNERLARARTQALKEYLIQVYPQLGESTIKVDFIAENWAGLREMIEESTLESKADLLNIIDTTLDLEARERKLKSFRGGTIYRQIANNMFPALRNTNYKIEYVIRDYSPEEARRLVWTSPQLLSLEEIFSVSKLYDWKSSEFSELFEIAVRLYPQNSIANINASTSALVKKDLTRAKVHLERVVPEERDGMYYNNLGVYYLLREDFKTAEKHLETALNKGCINAEENLRQTRLKIRQLERR